MFSIILLIFLNIFLDVFFKYFAAVEKAASLNDQAVVVDLLSVITLRPSIWNLDLCEALLPSIGELLQSKYEM